MDASKNKEFRLYIALIFPLLHHIKWYEISSITNIFNLLYLRNRVMQNLTINPNMNMANYAIQMRPMSKTICCLDKKRTWSYTAIVAWFTFMNDNFTGLCVKVLKSKLWDIPHVLASRHITHAHNQLSMCYIKITCVFKTIYSVHLQIVLCCG
jgi:hypothetical protein